MHMVCPIIKFTYCSNRTSNHQICSDIFTCTWFVLRTVQDSAHSIILCSAGSTAGSSRYSSGQWRTLHNALCCLLSLLLCCSFTTYYGLKMHRRYEVCCLIPLYDLCDRYDLSPLSRRKHFLTSIE